MLCWQLQRGVSFMDIYCRHYALGSVYYKYKCLFPIQFSMLFSICYTAENLWMGERKSEMGVNGKSWKKPKWDIIMSPRDIRIWYYVFNMISMDVSVMFYRMMYIILWWQNADDYDIFLISDFVDVTTKLKWMMDGIQFYIRSVLDIYKFVIMSIR